MKKMILIASCLVNSLLFAETATAQTEDVTVAVAAPRNEWLRPSDTESKNNTVAPAIEGSIYDVQYETDAPLVPNFFPSDFHNLVPTSVASSKLIFCLLGLILLGLVFSGLTGFGAKNQNEG